MLFQDASSQVARRNTAMLVVSSLLLTSCVTAPLSRDDRIGADDGSDMCRTYVVALDSTGNFFAEDMLKGALAGAATGALAGGITAALSGGNIAKGALIGVVAGGVAGAVGGYFKNRMEQGRDQAVLAINNDLNREVGELDKADTAMKNLVSCRIRQRDKIRADYAAKRISKPEAQSEWARLQQQVRKDKEVMNMVAENIGKRQDEYKYATDQMVTEFDASKLTPAERQQAQKRIASNNKKIENEHKQELSKIRQEMAQRKKENKAMSADLASEEQERIAQAKKSAEAKKSVNEKTGGNEQVVATASSFSASQSKKESIVATSNSYNAKLQVEDEGGFEKAAGIKNYRLPEKIVLSGACPIPEEGQGMTMSSIGWHVGPIFSLGQMGFAG